MATEWFREAVSGKPQTIDYLLPRMALTMTQPHHDRALRYSCHQYVARAIGQLHDEDKLESDYAIIFFGTKSMVYHSILARGDTPVCDLIGDVEGNFYDPKNECYHSGTFAGRVPVKQVVPVDEFFKDYVAKLTGTPKRDSGPVPTA